MKKYKFTLDALAPEHWIEVKIYNTRSSYRRARKRVIMNSISKIVNKKRAGDIPTSAMTFIATKPRDDGRVAEIYFNGQDFYAGIISHELTHLAIWYWKFIMKKKLENINKVHYEEQFCDLCGVIMQNFNDEILSKLFKK